MASADVVIAFDARLGNLEAATKRISASLNNVDRQAKQAQQSVASMSSSVSASFGSMAKAAAGFAAGLLSVSAAVSAFSAAFKFADELADMAEQIGVSVEQLQTLQLAVINAGGSSEKANKGLIRLGELIGDATRGGEEAAKTFMKLGISYQTVDGAARSTSAVLEDLRVKLDGAATQQEKLSIAAEAFGAKNGPAMVVALSGISGGLAASAAKAVELNQALGKETTDAIGAVDDAMNALSTTISTQLALAIASVAPQLQAFLTWLADAVNSAGATIRQLTGTEGSTERITRELGLLKRAQEEIRAGTGPSMALTKQLEDLNIGVVKVERGFLGSKTTIVNLDTVNKKIAERVTLLEELDLQQKKMTAEPPLAKPGSNLPPEKAKKVPETDEEKEFKRRAEAMRDFAEALEKATRLPLEAFNDQVAKIVESFNLTNDFDAAGGPETFLRGVLKAGEEAAQALDKAGMSTAEATKVMRDRLLELAATFQDQGIGAVDDWAARVDAAMARVSDAADKSLAKDIKGVFTSWGSSIEQAFSGIIDGTTKTADAFDSMVKAIINSLATLVARRFILKPLEAALDPIIESLSKLNFGSFFSGAPATPSAMGNVFAGGRLMAYAQGGVVSRPTLFPMARGMGLMGEAGPEGILPLSRAASGRLGVDASGMGQPVVVNVVNAAPNTTTRAEEKQGLNGKDISIFIEQQVQQGIAQGRFDKSLSANFGVNRRGRY